MAAFGIEASFGPEPQPPDEPVPGTWGTDGGAGGRGVRMRTVGAHERSPRAAQPVVRRAIRVRG